LEERADEGSGFFHNTGIITEHENAPAILSEVGGKDIVT
jgi:hypothetical protein